MASVVETQRLISVSLGKIAQSRAQRGGINLHKNLLVASVLNKARTAFMMENYSHQLSLQHQKQQQQQVILTTPQPAPACNSVPTASAEPQRAGNSLSSYVVKTCRSTTQDVESGSTSIDTQVTSGPVNGASAVHNNTVPVVNDKENISPSTENIPTPPVSEESSCEHKQQSISGEQHIEAANQLSHDAQLAGSPASCNNSSVYSSCKQQSAPSTTCNGVLKRRRDNPEALISNDSDCPASKKARVSSDCSYSQSCDISRSCEYESEGESNMQTSDSPQISNLVTIFNSGFSGLCVSSSSSSYESTHQSDNSSMSHQWSSSRKLSDSQPLHCSSQVERIGSLSSAIVLSA